MDISLCTDIPTIIFNWYYDEKKKVMQWPRYKEVVYDRETYIIKMLAGSLSQFIFTASYLLYLMCY